MDDKAVKRISLYEAKTGKSRGIAIKCADFKSPEELDAYIRGLRAQQKIKNQQVKADRKREQITKVINAPVLDMSKMSLSEGDIDLKLDKKTGSTVLILGCSKRGKSTLMMHIYDKYFSADKSFISTLFSGNPHLKIYKGSGGNDKRLIIGYGFNASSSKYVQLQQYINVKTANHYKFLNMFDDVVDSKYNIILKKLVLTYRNSNISSIICLQDVIDLEKKARGSINHSFVFGCNTTENARQVIDLILRPYFIEAGITDKDAMMATFKKITEDHGFFYIDNIAGIMKTGRLKI